MTEWYLQCENNLHRHLESSFIDNYHSIMIPQQRPPMFGDYKTKDKRLRSGLLPRMQQLRGHRWKAPTAIQYVSDHAYKPKIDVVMWVNEPGHLVGSSNSSVLRPACPYVPRQSIGHKCTCFCQLLHAGRWCMGACLVIEGNQCALRLFRRRQRCVRSARKVSQSLVLVIQEDMKRDVPSAANIK